MVTIKEWNTSVKGLHMVLLVTKVPLHNEEQESKKRFTNPE